MSDYNTSLVQQMHLEAMEFCDEAIAARARQDDAQAKRLFRQAFEREREAASALRDETNLEPTRSVLFRSAAALALECGEHCLAEDLISSALAGQPPGEIADELRELQKKIENSRSERIFPHDARLARLIGVWNRLPDSAKDEVVARVERELARAKD